MIDPFQNLLPPALLGCFRENTRTISNAWAPCAGATAEFWKGSMHTLREAHDEAGAPHRRPGARAGCWVLRVHPVVVGGMPPSQPWRRGVRDAATRAGAVLRARGHGSMARLAASAVPRGGSESERWSEPLTV
jgi:hypothetical protein